MAGKSALLLASLLGGVAGFVGGQFGSSQAPSGPSLEVAALEARLAALEARRADAPGLRGEVRAPLAGTPAAAVPTGGEALERGLIEVLRAPSAELRTLLAAAPRFEGGDLPEGTPPAKEGGADGAVSLDKRIEGIDAQIDSAAETYGLHHTQVEALKELTRRALARTAEAQAAGAGKEDLRRLEVDVQGEVRQILGEDTYAAVERSRVTREARGKLTWLSAAVGLTEAQHTRLDAILAEGVERALPDVIRVRTEHLSPQAFEEAQARLGAGRTKDWDRIRNDLLTPEQRARIPGK
jgi:hypothetical protein